MTPLAAAWLLWLCIYSVPPALVSLRLSAMATLVVGATVAAIRLGASPGPMAAAAVIAVCILGYVVWSVHGVHGVDIDHADHGAAVAMPVRPPDVGALLLVQHLLLGVAGVAAIATAFAPSP